MQRHYCDLAALTVQPGSTAWASGTHCRGSACFCKKATAAGALQVMYVWMNCTNLLIKGARWREDFR
jgi:hypothetical protein